MASAAKKRLLSDVRNRYKSGGRHSPEPNCPICLEPIEDRAFANKCFHDFCRTCLVEWSKVKAECPVCRQRFDRIIYNVKAMDEYEEQHVQPRMDNFACWHNLDNVQRSMFPNFPISAHAHASTTQSTTHHHFRHHFPTTSLTPLRRSVLELQSLIDNFNNVRRFSLVISSPSTSSASVTSHLTTHTAPVEPIPPVTTSEYRRYIYRSGLWVLPFGTGDKKRYRESSAEFYRRNPAVTHRLVPWLNREMVALLAPSADVPGVVEEIMRSIRRCNIASDEFRRVVLPIISNYTDHFIHEFYNFARSCYDMEAYSKVSKYVPKERADLGYTREMVPKRYSPAVRQTQTMPLNLSNDNDTESDSDSSVIIVDSTDSEEGTQSPSSSSSPSSSMTQTDLTESNSSSNTREEETEAAVSSINVNIGASDRELSITVIDDFDNPTPGPSGVKVRKVLTTLVEKGSDSETDIDVGGKEDNEAIFNDTENNREDGGNHDDSDDSVEIVEVLKPKNERTPEIIDVIESDEEMEHNQEIQKPKLIDDTKEKMRKDSLHKRHSRSHKRSKHKRERRKRRRSRSRSYSRHRSSSSSSSDDEPSSDRYWKLSTHVMLPRIKLSRFQWSSSEDESMESIRRRHDSKKYSSDEPAHFTPKLQSVIISPTNTPLQRGGLNTQEY